ncbi:MAG: drug/metabolite-transporting permease [Chitinophagaceae bacterium]|nr:MAG: drug/metabolite-transporting permease [Chitinophagaceae bacterium]
MPNYRIYGILSITGKSIRRLSVLNPLTIHRKGQRSKSIFALSLVCFFWGTTWVASKIGVSHMPALQMAAIRQLVAGLLFVGFFLYRRLPLPKGKEWLTILVLSFLNFVLSNSFTAWGIQYIPSGLGSIIGATFPLWLVVIGLFGKSTRLPFKALLGFLLGFSGICIIFYEHLSDFLQPGFRLGIFLSVFATLTWAFGTIYTKKEAAGFNPYFSLGLQMLISGTILLFTTKSLSLAGVPAFIPIAEIPWQAWMAILYLVVFGSIVAFGAYLYALQNLSTEQTSVYAYINPVVAIILGAIIFHEDLSFFIAIGGAVTLLGVFLVNRGLRTPVRRKADAASSAGKK